MPRREPVYTVDQYLEMERRSPERHVYLDGDILLMAGESPQHADISANLAGLLFLQLEGTPCRPRIKDTKVRSGPTPMHGWSTKGFFSYPDILVICGEPEYHDSFKDVVLNPSVIVEVLSDSTESFDRGEKFDRYLKWNPTLTDYLLVRQDRPEINHYTRQDAETWTYKIHEGLDARVSIASIRSVLELARVYQRVVFPDAPLEGE